MNLLDEYSDDKRLESEVLREETILIMKNGQLTEYGLLIIIKRAFELGHYVGHCQGEKYVKELHGQLLSKDY